MPESGIKKLLEMIEPKKIEDLSVKIKEALDKATKKIIEEEKARNGFLVVAGKNGTVEKIPARSL